MDNIERHRNLIETLTAAIKPESLELWNWAVALWEKAPQWGDVEDAFLNDTCDQIDERRRLIGLGLRKLHEPNVGFALHVAGKLSIEELKGLAADILYLGIGDMYFEACWELIASLHAIGSEIILMQCFNKCFRNKAMTNTST